MNNKILKDLIKELISNCNNQIKEIKNDIENVDSINKIKTNISSIINISDDIIKDILNNLDYNKYYERLDLERHLFEIKKILLNKGVLSNIHYSYINDFYNKIDYYLEHNSKENNKMINDLLDMISLYNSLLNKMSLINGEFIDEVDVVDLVLRNSDFSYNIKKDILRSIMNYNKELYMRNI